MKRCVLGRTGIPVSPLVLSAWSVRAAGEAGLKLSAEDVERAFHEHGVNAFLVTWQMKRVATGSVRYDRSRPLKRSRRSLML